MTQSNAAAEMNMELSERDTPKINGSVGAFVAVVVCLIIVISACSGAIYYLIREQRVYDSGRGRHKRGTYKTASHAPMPTHETDGTINAWRDRLSSLFSKNAFGSTRSREVQHTRGHGWMQAGSVDDWDVEVGNNDVHYDQPSILQTPSKTHRSHTSAETSVSRSNTASTTNSVRFELPPIRSMSNSDLRGLQSSMLPRLASPPTSRSNSPMPVRTLSPEPASSNISGQTTSRGSEAQRFSSYSPAPHSRSSGSSKFIEIL